MNKKEFYKIQAEAFRDYAKRIPNKDLRTLFDQWADSKDFCDIDKDGIWGIVKD